ncbi:MAG: MATE family efflux transporter [Desulfovibrionaceae bacterium]|nr:MATE family efflux transporter [Desulfovibrionaceae bacterium]
MAFFSKLSTINMLEGSIWDKLIVFSLPLALTNVLQQLFITADVTVLGNAAGRDAMASVGSLTPAIGLFVSLFLGFSIGSNVVIAKHFGSGSSARVHSASRATLTLALLLGFGCFFLCFPYVHELLVLLAIPEEIQPLSESYFSWYLPSLPFLSLYNFAAAMLRSKGDTATPFLALAAASLINIVGNLIAVALGYGVSGVAFATTFANAASAFFLLVRIVRQPVFAVFQKVSGVRAELQDVVRIGFPAAIQGMVFCFSNIVVQSAINSLGPVAIAGSAAAFVIEINMYCLMSAFAQAETTFVSQNFGAKNLRRCLAVTRVTLYLTLPLNICLSLIIYLAAPYLLGFLSSDPAVIETAMIRICAIVLPNVITIFIDILSGALRGYGCSMPPAIATLIAICCIRIAWCFTVFTVWPDFTVLLVSYPLSWFVTAVLIALVYFRFKKVVLFHRHSIQQVRP